MCIGRKTTNTIYLSEPFKSIVETVHSLPLPRVGLLTSQPHDLWGGGPQVLLPASLLLSGHLGGILSLLDVVGVRVGGGGGVWGGGVFLLSGQPGLPPIPS